MVEGGRKPTVSDEEILRSIKLHPDPIVTAKEVAESIEMTRQGAHNRLEEMVGEAYLKRKEVGSRAVVYWLTEDGKEKAAETP